MNDYWPKKNLSKLHQPSTRHSCPRPRTQKAGPTPTVESTPLTYHTKGRSAAGGVDKEVTAVKTAKMLQIYFAAGAERRIPTPESAPVRNPTMLSVHERQAPQIQHHRVK